jgi:hypothetical protein
MIPPRRRAALLPALCAWALLGALCASPGRRVSAPSSPPPEPGPSLAQLIESLSEPGGYFHSDNLVSNETAYLQVAERLQDTVEPGGVYLGVGPDQNFSYIARLRPRWAFVLDIRRGNMLQHLLFNALFAASEDRYEYLCRLLSRPCPAHTRLDPETGVEGLIAAAEAVAPSEQAFESNLASVLDHVERKLSFPLTQQDRADIRAVYRAFFEEQLDIRFRTSRRPWSMSYPSYRSLLLARSPSDRFGHFLASAQDYRFLRDLESAGRVVPVVGDFAGPTAMRAIAALLRERGQTVSVFYLSNVEFYLVRSEAFEHFAANVRQLPLKPDSVFIRACFDFAGSHPAAIAGHRHATLLQRIPRFLELHASGAYGGYWDLCTADYLP